MLHDVIFEQQSNVTLGEHGQSGWQSLLKKSDTQAISTRTINGKIDTNMSIKSAVKNKPGHKHA